MKNIQEDWWDQLKAVNHEWSEIKTLTFYGNHHLFGNSIVEKFKGKECKICKVIDKGHGILYESCNYLTVYPADVDGPCFCTRRKYLEAHGII